MDKKIENNPNYNSNIEEALIEETSTLPKPNELPDKEGLESSDNLEVNSEELVFENVDIDEAVTEISEVIKPAGIQFPQIDPVLFELGPLAIRWYSLAYLVGILLGWVYMQYLNKKHNDTYISQAKMDAFPLWIILGVIIGGRLGYVLFYNFTFYTANLSETYKIWNGGMSFHGGLIGVATSMLIFAKIYRLKYFKVMDLLAVATPIGLFLGRIANFINAELWGRRTAWEYGVIFPNDNFARHPSQLYEAFLEGLVLFFILLSAVKLGALKKAGLCSGLFLLFYGIFRFAVEFFREPDIHLGFLYGTNWLTMGMVLCAPMLLIGLVIILISLKSRESSISN